MPSTRTSPWSGSSSRLISFIAVVLPEPDAPTSAMKAPASTASETSRSAKVRPPSNDLLTWSSSMSGAVAIGKGFTRSLQGAAAAANPQSRRPFRRGPCHRLTHLLQESLNWGEHIEFARWCRAAYPVVGVIYPPRNRRQVFGLVRFVLVHTKPLPVIARLDR